MSPPAEGLSPPPSGFLGMAGGLSSAKRRDSKAALSLGGAGTLGGYGGGVAGGVQDGGYRVFKEQDSQDFALVGQWR